MSMGSTSRTDDIASTTNSPNRSVGSDASLDMDYAADTYGGDLLEGVVQEMGEGEALVYQHPDFTKMLSHWKKYLAMYKGKDVWQFIHRHLRESPEMFDNRVKRGYYYNYVASVVDLYIAYIFHSPITRVVDEAIFGDLYEDADLRGTTFSTYIQLVATFAQICGFCGVLVDMPKLPDGGFETEEDRKNAGHRPYLTMVRATQILDWELDRFDNFVWVKIEIQRPQDRSWKTTVDTEKRHFLIWTQDSWEEWEYINDDTARKVDGGSHDLGEVPLVILKNQPDPDHPWFGTSAVSDISDINIGILNWASLGDEEIYERCLNVLTMEHDESNAGAEISHHNVLEFSPGATPPSYLTPGTTPLDMIKDWITQAKDEIYRLAKFGGSVGLLGVRQATSGIAYAFEFNETNQALGKKAANIESAELSIHRLYAKWLGKDDSETAITYPKEFGVEDFLSEFQILAEARSTLTSKTAIQEIEKKLLAKIFAADPSDLRETILQEVEAADPQAFLEPPMTETPRDEVNPGTESQSLGNPGENEKTGDSE